jgi:hypothetical protein
MVDAEKITAQEIEHGQANQTLNADEILLQSLGYKQVQRNPKIENFNFIGDVFCHVTNITKK